MPWPRWERGDLGRQISGRREGAAPGTRRLLARASLVPPPPPRTASFPSLLTHGPSSRGPTCHGSQEGAGAGRRWTRHVSRRHSLGPATSSWSHGSPRPRRRAPGPALKGVFGVQHGAEPGSPHAGSISLVACSTLRARLCACRRALAARLQRNARNGRIHGARLAPCMISTSNDVIST